MMLGGLELRFPTFLLDDFWLQHSQTSGLLRRRSGMDGDRIKTSVGGGLRWLLSGQIPLRLDLAYPLNPTPFGEQSIRWHVNIFYTL